MSILVTGGTGFVGSYLVKELVKRNLDVVVFDYMPNFSLLSEVKNKCKIIKGDLTYPSDIFSVVFENKVTDIFHLGSVLAEVCEEKPFTGFKVNLEGTLNLLEAARLNNVNKFIFASSISVFGKDVNEPVLDNSIKNPATFYGITKLAAEHICRWYYQKYGLDVRGARFPWVYGPGRKRGITRLYSSSLLDRVALREEVEIENPEEKGDWIYVKDAVKALYLLWEVPYTKQCFYNISGGTHTIREVMKIVKRIMPEAIIRYKNNESIFSPYPSSYSDRLAQEELGWIPSYSIKKGVKEHLETVIEENRKYKENVNNE